MTIASIFIIAALICFILGAFGISSRVSLTDAGLACLTVAMLLGAGLLG